MKKTSLILVLVGFLSLFTISARADDVDRVRGPANFGGDYVITASSETLATATKLISGVHYRGSYDLRETGNSVEFYWWDQSFGTWTISGISLSTTTSEVPYYVAPGSQAFDTFPCYNGDIYVLPGLSTSSATIRGCHTYY